MNRDGFPQWFATVLLLWAIPAFLCLMAAISLIEQHHQRTCAGVVAELDHGLKDWASQARNALETRLNQTFERRVGHAIDEAGLASMTADLIGPFSPARFLIRFFDGRGTLIGSSGDPRDPSFEELFRFIRRPRSESVPFDGNAFAGSTVFGAAIGLVSSLRNLDGVLANLTVGCRGFFRWREGTAAGIGGLLVLNRVDPDPEDGPEIIDSLERLSIPGISAGYLLPDGRCKIPEGIGEAEFPELLERARALAGNWAVLRDRIFAVRTYGSRSLLIMTASQPRPPIHLLLMVLVIFALASGWILVTSFAVMGDGRGLGLPLRYKLALLVIPAALFPLGGATAIGLRYLDELRDAVRVEERKSAFERLEKIDADFASILANRELEYRKWVRDLQEGRLSIASLAARIDGLQQRQLLQDGFLISSQSQVLIFDYNDESPDMAWMLSFPLPERLGVLDRLLRLRRRGLSHRNLELVTGRTPIASIGSRIPVERKMKVRKVLPKIARDCIAHVNWSNGVSAFPPPSVSDLAMEEAAESAGGMVSRLMKHSLGRLVSVVERSEGDSLFADVICGPAGEGQHLLLLSHHHLHLQIPYLETLVDPEQRQTGEYEISAVCTAYEAQLGPNFPADTDHFQRLALQMRSDDLRVLETTVERNGKAADAILLKGTWLAGFVLAHVTPPELIERKLAPYRYRVGVAVGSVALLSVLFGWLLMSTFLRPVQELARGVEALTAKNLAYRVRVDSRNELGEICLLLNRTIEHMGEMEIAQAVQSMLYPAESLRVGKYEIIGRNRMTQAIGGDYYDYIPLPDGKVAVLLGDVAGHGLSAALVTAMAKAAFAILCPRIPGDPGNVLALCNSNLFDILKRVKMMTCQILLLDPQTGPVSITNAGHLYPLVYDGERLIELDLPSCPLGIKKGLVGKATVLPPVTGPIILMTDGLIEAVGPDGKQIGFHGFQAALQRGLATRPDAPTEGVFDEVRRLTDPVPWSDDATLIVIRRVG